jgi:PhoPQ-activated pathogenicity-related protein
LKSLPLLESITVHSSETPSMRLLPLWLASRSPSASLRFAEAKDAIPATDASPLIAYVQKPDPNYKWEVVKTIPGPTAETTVIKLTSQAWRGRSDVDRALWEHYLVVVKPAEVKDRQGLSHRRRRRQRSSRSRRRQHGR